MAVGLADREQARRSAGEIRARQQAAWTRRGSVDAGLLDVDTAPLAEVGLLLGTTTDGREPVVLSLEDQVGIIAATGAGKTLYLMIGAALGRPRPADHHLARNPRSSTPSWKPAPAKGRVWVFDPLDVAGWPEPMTWNPVAGAEHSAAAVARGKAFAAGFGADATDSSNPFFRHAAGIIVARLLHAAALSNGTMVDVVVLGAGAGTVHHRPRHPRRPSRRGTVLGENPARRQRGRRRNPVLRADDPGAEGGTDPVPHRDAANAPHRRGAGLRPRPVRDRPRTPWC